MLVTTNNYSDFMNNSVLLLTVIQTCRFQSRSVMDFFAQALMATIAIIERPSLIPQRMSEFLPEKNQLNYIKRLLRV